MFSHRSRPPSALAVFIAFGWVSAASASPVPFEFQAELFASDGEAEDWFGWSVDVDGSTAIITSPYRRRAGDGAYIFERDAAGVWTQQATLPRPPTPLTYDGNVVSIEGDIAVYGTRFDSDAGRYAGAVHVFERVGGIWTVGQKITAADGADYDNFGQYVDLSEGRLFVGSKGADEPGPGRGAVYVFERTAGRFVQSAKLMADDVSDDGFFGVPLAADGDTLLIGAPRDALTPGEQNGSAYVFERIAGVWTRQAKLIPARQAEYSRNGDRLALSGDVAVLSIDRSYGAVVFERVAGSWSATAELVDADFRLGVAAWGDDVFIASRSLGTSGEILQYTRDGSTWTLADRLPRSMGNPYDDLGSQLATDGVTLLAGTLGVDTLGNNAGAAYVFALDQRPQGEACDAALACQSGFCVDGYCCESACDTSECLACGAVGSEGTCAPVVGGVACGDPSATDCDAPDTCDATGVCVSNTLNDATPCEGPDYCSAGDSCQAGVCAEGDESPCDEGLVCVEDIQMCLSTCGNGELDANEDCDEGEANSDVVADACREDCRLPGCGDDVVDSGEECDEGEAGTATCTATCSVPMLPDGGVSDAGGADAGTDAGERDAGAGIDAPPSLDSGLDAAVFMPPADGGCGCRVTTRVGRGPWLALLLVGWLYRRRVA